MLKHFIFIFKEIYTYIIFKILNVFLYNIQKNQEISAISLNLIK